MLNSRDSAPNAGLNRQRRGNWRLLAGVTLACAVSVTFCACSSVFSELPASVGGLPANAPARPAVAPAYPAVHDMPPPRSAAVLSEEERKKIEAELAAMRAEQAKRAAAKGLPE
jgi:hypothetical protein